MSFSKREYKYWDMELKEISRAIKKELTHEFPHIIFTVRSKNKIRRPEINVRISQIDARYLKDRKQFVREATERCYYITQNEYKRALMQFDYTDFYLGGSIKDEVWNKIIRIYEKYNYFNNDEDNKIYDQRYFGNVDFTVGCRVTGRKQE